MKQKLSILFICLAMSIFSQEKIDIAFLNTPLLDVIKNVEFNFKVKFSYDPKITENIFFSFQNLFT